MKFAIVFIALFAIAVAAPAEEVLQAAAGHPVAEILHFENEQTGSDGYKFSFETSDGTSRQESAELHDVEGAENQALAVKGTVSWIGGDGKSYTLNYVADENGYHPTGDFFGNGKASAEEN